MICLVDPRPMSSFDPSKVALLHDNQKDWVIVWDPEMAEDWRRTANSHHEGIQWDGYVFDAWGFETAERAVPVYSVNPS